MGEDASENLMRPATASDIAHVVPRLRPADLSEIRAAVGLPASVAVPLCAESSDRLWALVAPDGEPCALLGTQPVFGQTSYGWVWMVATPVLEKHASVFLRRCRAALPEVYGPFTVLTNFADLRNSKHIKWLAFMGFKFIRVIPEFGSGGTPFVEFAGISPCVYR